MAMMLDRYLSRPQDVLWAGFRSTTVALQQAGWELSVDPDRAYDYGRRMRVALRHQGAHLYGISKFINCNYEAYHQRGSETRLPPLVVEYMACDFRVQVMDNLTGFSPIDAKPQFDTIEVKSIEDFNIFATPLVRTEEIIVEPQDVAAMLARIKELQAPEQAALRERQRLRARREGLDVEAVPRQNFHAQILSISDYREAA